MIPFNSEIVVLGAGAIGERHLANLIHLGFTNLYVFRQRNLPFRNQDLIGKVEILTQFSELDKLNPSAAFICTPSSLHMEQALYLAQRGIHMLIEKPLSHTTEQISLLKHLAELNSVLIKTGYMLRYHPLLMKINEFIKDKRYGNLVHLSTYWGEYLPDWHPWEDYRNSYAAKKDLGGGAALTLSHDLDIANWLAGSAVDKWNTTLNFKSRLEVDSNCAADFSISYINGVTAHVHVNFFQPVPKRVYQFEFDNASVELSYYNSTLEIKTKEKIEQIIEHKFERNQLFLDQTIDFLNLIGNTDHQAYSNRQLSESELIINICNNEH